MDNQPLDTSNNQLEGDAQALNVSTPPVANSSTSPDLLDRPMIQSADDPTSPQPKKKKTGLIIGIIIALVVLLGGGGAFAAIAIIKNQPDNILGEAINHFANAKQIAVDGTIELTPTQSFNTDGSASLFGIESVKLTLGTEFNKSGQSDSSSGLHLTLSDGNNLDLAITEETTILDGVIYIKIGGIETSYQQIIDQLFPVYGFSADIIPAEAQTVITEIIQLFDNQWIKISIDEILNHELLADFLTTDNKTLVRQYYDCTMSTLFDNDAASQELARLYEKNSFIKLEPAADSFYNVSVDSARAANFVNALPKADFVAAYAQCLDYDLSSSSVTEVTKSDIDLSLASMPQISAKFDGFLDHHLSEIKIHDTSSSSFTTTYDFKFTYPSSIMQSSPTNARPIMDLIVDISQKASALSSLYTYGYGDYDYDYDDYDWDEL